MNYSYLFSHLAKTVEPDACKITLDPTAQQNLHVITKPRGNIYLLIGAEGGLTDEEIALAKTYGFQSVQLGPRILRTETAALAAISAMQTLWGDF
jgi:16S rRNA (uracil1498-N3)-methyltransferase